MCQRARFTRPPTPTRLLRGGGHRVGRRRLRPAVCALRAGAAAVVGPWQCSQSPLTSELFRTPPFVHAVYLICNSKLTLRKLGYPWREGARERLRSRDGDGDGARRATGGTLSLKKAGGSDGRGRSTASRAHQSRRAGVCWVQHGHAPIKPKSTTPGAGELEMPNIWELTLTCSLRIVYTDSKVESVRATGSPNPNAQDSTHPRLVLQQHR